MLTWIKRFGAILLAALAAVVGAGWLWSVADRKLGKPRSRKALAESRGKLEELRGARAQLESSTTMRREAISEIDRRIADTKREIVELHERALTDMTDEEINAEFERLGF